MKLKQLIFDVYHFVIVEVTIVYGFNYSAIMDKMDGWSGDIILQTDIVQSYIAPLQGHKAIYIWPCISFSGGHLWIYGNS